MTWTMLHGFRVSWMLSVAVIGAVASSLLVALDIERKESEERGRIVAELAAVRARLEGTIKSTFGATDGLVNLVAIEGGIERKLFDEMARLLLRQNRAIRNITVAPDDTVRMVFPLSGNEKVLGFSFSSRPEQNRTVQLARERGSPVLAGPQELVQGGRGLINRAPVFHARDPAKAPSYWGTISIVAYLDAIVRVGDFPAAQGLRIALRGQDGQGEQGALIHGAPGVFSADPVLMNVEVPGGYWQLGAVPEGGWPGRYWYRSPYLWFGFVVTVLAMILIGQRGAHLRAAQAKNRELEQEMAERHKMAMALQEEERRFRVLFESSPDPVWIIEGNRFVECNRAAARILGYGSPDAVLFVHPSRLSPEFQPDGQPSFEKAERMMALAKEHGVHRFEWMHTRADGSDFPAEVTLSSVALQGRQVIYCVWQDISERKLSEERLKLSAAVLAATAEGVMITDVQGRIVSVNRAFTEITGYAEEEALGREPNLLRSERHEPEFYQAMWRSLREAGVWQGELWNRRKNGELYPEWLTISAIRDTRGAVTHYVGVFSDISSIKRSQDQLERLAHFDPLTDLPNRALFQDRLAHAIDRGRRYQYGIAVLLLDLDGFKTVNDSLGHPAGDRLLQLVAERLRECIRVEDTVARLGGDEFAIILANMKEGADAVEVVRKILASMQVPFDLDGLNALVTGSIGIAVFPADGDSATELVRNADAAMYGAKEAGRNAYRFYRAEMTHKAQERLQRETALRRAIENNEFEVWYQPQINLRTGRPTGAEALVRWRDPQRGLVPAGEFIPLAERTGLIVAIGDQVLSSVCAQARRWLDAGMTFGRIAVNVAAPQFERSDFAGTLCAHLEASRLPAECLEVEVTESLIMENSAEAREVLLMIQSVGVTTAIDDFGTGYSSLAYLKELPIDTLKIDRAFVKGLPEAEKDATIARTIIAMAHSLGFKVTAEGIETEAQRRFFEQEGCDEAQGYLLGKPMPAAEFEAWMTQRPR